MRKRVVITYMGVICSAGRGVDEFRKSLIAGKTCISRVEDPRIAHFGPQFAYWLGKSILLNWRIPHFPQKTDL